MLILWDGGSTLHDARVRDMLHNLLCTYLCYVTYPVAPGLADTSKISTLFDIVIFYVSMAEEDNGIVSMMQENRMSYNRFVDQ